MTSLLRRAALLCLAAPIATYAANAATGAPGASVSAGEKLYQTYCAGCHGAKLDGGEGPSLIDQTWIHGAPTKTNLVNIISKGVAAKGMPAWSPTLSAQQIAQLADFIAVAPKRAASTAAVTAAPSARAGADDGLAGLKLPKGFRITVYADRVENARSMTVSDAGIVYVGSHKAGKIYALVDDNRDGVAERVVTVAEGLQNPIGVTILNGALYVAETSRILRFDAIDKTYAARPAYKVVKDDLPKDTWHGGKYIKAGPDGKIYVPVGAPCNTCDKENEIYSKLWRMNPDGSAWEEFARGIRNTVGFAWHPQTRQLWFTDNGPDEMGENTPSCELNVAPKAGLHFGFPYCHGGVIPDPKFGNANSCEQYVPPVAQLGPHVAPLGMAFYTGTQFPQAYRNQAFIAEHGSWNRENKIGYQVSLVTLYGNKAVSKTSFIEGFLQRDDKVIGRPVDLAVMADGALLISDDFAGKVYRVTYQAR